MAVRLHPLITAIGRSRATFFEAWGELYFRNQLGIHQVHSRRASCSVPQDHIGRDGAIRFSREYNLAGTRKEDFIMDLFQRLEAQRLAAENSAGLGNSVAPANLAGAQSSIAARPGIAPTPDQPVAALPKAVEKSLEAK